MIGTEVFKDGKWEPRWQSPTIRVACPTCGELRDRNPHSWTGAGRPGLFQFRLSCDWDLKDPERHTKEPKCWAMWDIIIDTNRPHNFEPGVEVDLSHQALD